MDGKALLLRFHSRHPGSSALVFGGADAGDGRNSYDHLADRVQPGEHGTVLDLGCGDGLLLEVLHARHGDAVALSGVDMSPDELEAARVRLGPAPVTLYEAQAQALPLPDASFDAVISHMALMLMSDLDTVVAELARVLRPGGLLAAVTGARGKPTEVARRVFDRLAELRDDDGRSPVPIGDDRVRSVNGLREVFGGPSWKEVTVAPFHLSVSVPASELFSWLEVAYYPIDALAEGKKRELRAWIDENGESLAPGGRMRWSFFVHLFTVHRRLGA